MRFGSYNLNKELMDALNTLGYVEATPIQEKVLAKALKGKSLICKSETGSGKTHAFLIPILNNIDKTLNKVQALVISPTVELAHQTYEFAKKICDKIEGLSCKEISSSSDKNINLEQLAFGGSLPKLLIGTPGRLFDLFIKERKDCSAIKTIVLDEADMLIDNSYIEEIDALISTISPSQRLVFTATMKEHLIADTYKFVKAEEIIDIDRKIKVNRNVSHHLVNIKHKDIILGNDGKLYFGDANRPNYYISSVDAEKGSIMKQMTSGTVDDSSPSLSSMTVSKIDISLSNVEYGAAT